MRKPNGQSVMLPSALSQYLSDKPARIIQGFGGQTERVVQDAYARHFALDFGGNEEVYEEANNENECDGYAVDAVEKQLTSVAPILRCVDVRSLGWDALQRALASNPGKAKFIWDAVHG
jgi:hypothetical protein